MFKKTKKEKQLESYINNQSLMLTTNSNGNNKKMLTNKRERENSKSPHAMKSIAITEQKSALTSQEQIGKIFQIANKQQSLSKCIKLIKLSLIKIYNENKSLFDVISFLYRIDRQSFKAIDMSINQNLYKELYQYAFDEIVSKHKEKNKEPDDDDEYALDIIESFKISFVLMGELFTDDSFLFNSTSKKIHDQIISLSDYSSNEKDIDGILSNVEAIKSSNRDDRMLSLLAIKRTLFFDCYESMLNAKTQMKTSVIQSYAKLIVNKEKLSPKQQKRLNELIKTIKDNHNNTKTNVMENLDLKTKSNPLESYYEVNDAREEKYIISNMNQWESKQNGIESTKQYFG